MRAYNTKLFFRICEWYFFFFFFFFIFMFTSQYANRHVDGCEWYIRGKVIKFCRDSTYSQSVRLASGRCYAYISSSNLPPNLPWSSRLFYQVCPPPPILTNDHFTHREGYRVLLHAQYHTSNTRGLSSHKSNSRRDQAIVGIEFTREKQGSAYSIQLCASLLYTYIAM